MYNCFFGMPFGRNFSCQNTFNKIPQPNTVQKCNVKQDTKKNPCKNHSVSTANRNSLKYSSLGGIVIPPGTTSGTTYNLISINLDTSYYNNFSIYFNFSCNITCTIAVGGIHLKFQLFRHEKYSESLIPISSSFNYARGIAAAPFTETNTFSFTAYDSDALRYKSCNYSLIIEIMVFNNRDSIMITNPILIAEIIENNNFSKKGEDYDI